MNPNTTKRLRAIDAEEWDHSRFEELEQEEKTKCRMSAGVRKELNQNSSADQISNQGTNGKWIHNRTQEEDEDPSSLYLRDDLTEHQTKPHYKCLSEQEEEYLKNERLMEVEHYRSFEFDGDEEENDDDGEASNTSLRVSSDKFKLSSNEKSYSKIKRSQASYIMLESDSTDVSPSSKATDIYFEPFFELSITFSDENSGELKIYEVVFSLTKALINFLKYQIRIKKI